MDKQLWFMYHLRTFKVTKCLKINIVPKTSTHKDFLVNGNTNIKRKGYWKQNVMAAVGHIWPIRQESLKTLKSEDWFDTPSLPTQLQE